MLSAFIEDERGVYSSAYKLALAVIIFAALLALLSGVLEPVEDSAINSTENIEEARKLAVDKAMRDIQE